MPTQAGPNPSSNNFQEYLDLNQEFEGWSFLFCQLNYTLHREYPIWTDVVKYNLIKLKLTALNHSANSLSGLILLRFELKFHSYQKCTLPIKLKNFEK